MKSKVYFTKEITPEKVIELFKCLEKELPGYRVINYGLYAGLGTAVMLDLAEPHIRAGDIVVFLPEQSRHGSFAAELL